MVQIITRLAESNWHNIYTMLQKRLPLKQRYFNDKLACIGPTSKRRNNNVIIISLYNDYNAILVELELVNCITFKRSLVSLLIGIKFLTLLEETRQTSKENDLLIY